MSHGVEELSDYHLAQISSRQPFTLDGRRARRELARRCRECAVSKEKGEC